MNSVASRPRHFRRSPSSILSSDSDIQFTRKKLTSLYKCGCWIIAAFLLFMMVASVVVYLIYTHFILVESEEQVFRGTFRITNGDTFSSELANPNTKKFKSQSRKYAERLNLLFRRSAISHGFVKIDVLALDGTEDKDLIIHFNVHIDPKYENVKAENVENILAEEIKLTESLYFHNLTIDPNSLEVKPIDLIPDAVPTTVPSTNAISQAITHEPEPPRRCAPLQLKYCHARSGHNVTTYPNILGHKNIRHVKEDVIKFRELVDAECYKHAYQFVCQVLQPSCAKGDEDEEENIMILPCRNFCNEFMAGCSDRLSANFKKLLSCDKFPEFENRGTCMTKPGCVEELQSRALSSRICDGEIDCEDLSDEVTCAYCAKNHIHCGIGTVCIHKSKRCNGKTDCPDGSDERDCLSLTPKISTAREQELITPHTAHYHEEGYVTFNEKGEIGKLCVENLNQTVLPNATEILHTVASSLCKSLSYQSVSTVHIEKDLEPNVSYVSMKDPLASEITFIRSPCRSKQVLKVSCSNLECGIQRTHGKGALQALAKIAVHGDWPWHVALFKGTVHICDGTLVSSLWVITTTSCFQGQPKAEWTAHLGTTRLTSTTPWKQERRIVGMVKSPVEGSTIALVKLEKEVMYNDFVRPICLPDETVKTDPDVQMDCNTIGWVRTREQMQRLQIKITAMEKCENISISTLNSFCVETYYGKNDCSEEEFAGTPMMCRHPLTNSWTLMGVTNWRLACSKEGVERPRMYDKISSNVMWIKNTLTNEAT